MTQHSEPLATLRALDYDRYLISIFADQGRRPHLVALYAFNAEIAQIPDRVSEPLLGAMRLRWWLDGLDGIFSGNPPGHPVAQGLSAAQAACGLSRERIETLLEARFRDLDEVPSADLPAVEAYADATAGTLAALTAEALGADPELQEAARRAGTAYGLVGLVRAAPHHATRHRCILPHDLLKKAGISVDALCEGKAGPTLAQVTGPMLSRAEQILSGAASLRLPRALMPALLPAVLARHHLKALRRRRGDPFQGNGRSGAGALIKLGWATWRCRV